MNNVDLRHLSQTEDSNEIEVGIDLADYYISVEWDILKVPAKRNEKFYSCCEEPYPDIIFNITLRRKTLFYTVNLIIPCVGISFLSVLVFYLPSHSGEKVSLSISILLSLTVFFLLLAEIIPPTSLTVPLLGKYLLFTMVLVTLSVVVTIAVLNVNFRSPVTHHLPGLPVTIPPVPVPPSVTTIPNSRYGDLPIPVVAPRFDESALPPIPLPGGGDDELFVPASPGYVHDDASPTFERPLAREIEKTIEDARFIAQHAKNKDRFESVEEDWKYVAMVLDRIFLWFFTIACFFGTALIILQAPSPYDETKPIDIIYSKIAQRKMMLKNMGPEEDD
ncbi:Similar to nAChRalpha1: Acetylcholine receptor subunit alpha-like 1 (Drosophila melanogaster) [Cotesia congregata]|uniref:Similar to nAChRalpha1: Acetylcholine receptor subunit alpha-like 1 (Drosophila melanogaster) n=1 Tax=Cotesia congregata TaxID=51543 RepID=A0A8J2MPY2_COTCN|nr:Similar to nAChRalpha1: Acetylcholine receptor subunit alpha-like 1 (Drosophila melanogaster) [Cotesia congregata]